LFWRIFASFWLAIALVAGLAMLVGRALNQDSWIINQHPAFRNLAERWVHIYEQDGPIAAQMFLELHKQKFHVDVQVLGENGQPRIRGTFPPRAAAFEARQNDDRRLPWRRLTDDYVSPRTGEMYLLIYRIPYPELAAWNRNGSFVLSLLGIVIVVLTVLSVRLTLSITRPLNRLRGAVHDLGQTAYQQNSLARLSDRRDELGVLARDFNRMGSRLQGLIGSQRQLLRDVSHELRSPLARLRVAIALAERANSEEREKLWPRLTRECDRLEALISEILVLARLDAEPGAAKIIKIAEILGKLREDSRLAAPDQQVQIHVEQPINIEGWPEMLERALDNLLRNALRFNPEGKPIEIKATASDEQVCITVRDHGPGVAPDHLSRLGEPFYRAPDQSEPGYGLGLAIARRAVQRHGGRLALENHCEGGFISTITLPVKCER
jgi:signal transduction histidine kinase